jgi:hypothetical protein
VLLPIYVLLPSAHSPAIALSLVSARKLSYRCHLHRRRAEFFLQVFLFAKFEFSNVFRTVRTLEFNLRIIISYRFMFQRHCEGVLTVQIAIVNLPRNVVEGWERMAGWYHWKILNVMILL